ncbi:hypothetical protein ACIBL3_11655 [Kribbella sp. NPDC050124]|uniref:hypothetical protein n=1 Tax=Kribbella sp. NPDC050124 TaxID=3364114 RepID=UPI0037AA7570
MYDVVMLVEEELSSPDADRVVGLHASVPDHVRYHVIVPCEDAQARVQSSLSGLASTEFYGLTAERHSIASEDEMRTAQRQAQEAVDAQANAALERSIDRLRSLGQDATGLIAHGRPLDELSEQIQRVNGQEVVVLTRPHVVAEFFHVDWSSQARRHLGVPVLHLLEAHNS